MAVLFPGKFIYLATPHTASISTTKALAGIEGSVASDLHELKDIDLGPRKFPGGTHHAELFGLQRQTPEYFTGREISVTTIRNPYDLIVTWWFRQRRNLIEEWGREVTFREYVEIVDENTPGGPYIRKGRIFWHKVDEILRYESLQEDLNRFLERFELPRVELVPANVTTDKGPWQSHYDDGIRSIAERRFGQEAKEHGYEFSG